MSRPRWALVGLPVAAIVSCLCVYTISLDGPGIRPRELHTYVASGTLTVDTRPPTAANSGAYLFGLLTYARFVERVAGSSGTVRRLTTTLRLPPNALLGAPGPVRLEQPPERVAGSPESRAYTIIRQRTPYEVSTDAYAVDPLIRVSVRGPDQATTARILQALPAAVNAEIRSMADDTEPRIDVENRAGVTIERHGIPSGPTAVVLAIAVWLFWWVLGYLLRLEVRVPLEARRLADGY